MKNILDSEVFAISSDVTIDYMQIKLWKIQCLKVRSKYCFSELNAFI